MASDSKVKIEPTSRSNAIRATPVQTAMLRKSFEVSHVPSSEQLKALSEAACLPEKWIVRWFGRERVKKSKSKGPGFGPDSANISASSTSSSDPTLSPEEILRVKLENHDPISISPLASLPPNAESSPPTYLNGSEHWAATVSGSSSALLDRPFLIAGLPIKKRTRAPRTKNLNQNSSPNPPTSRVRKPRTKRKAAGTTQISSTKMELIELPTNSMVNFTAGSLPPAFQAANPTAEFTSPDVHRPIQLLPVPPAQRTPLTPASQTQGNLQYRTFSLSANHFDSIYPPQPVEETLMQDNCQRDALSQFQRAQLATYQQGPVFHSQFHNNGPANYSQELAPVTTAPQNDSSFNTNLPVPNHCISHPLAPVFDWKNDPSSELPSQPPQLEQITTPELELQYPPMEYFENLIAAEHEPVNLRISPHELGAPLVAQLQHSDSFKEFLDGTVLDPLVAPLKHITDILQDFKDEHGTYMPLIMEQEREKLISRLLDQNLVDKSPFQAAMGLSLLSKLGIEWEM